MAEEQKKKKPTRTKKEPVAKKEEVVVKVDTDALIAENEELKKRVETLTDGLEAMQTKCNDLQKNFDALEAAREDEKDTSDIYRFVAKYDNIQLDGVVLNNVKCVIYECEAETFDAAMGLFDSYLKKALNVTDSMLNDVKGRIFGGKMIVEHEVVEFAEEIVGKRK